MPAPGARQQVQPGGLLGIPGPDELLEVTPENLRIRKRILDHDLRMKAASKKNK